MSNPVSSPVNTSLTVGISPDTSRSQIPLRLVFGPMGGTGTKDVQLYPAVDAEVFVTAGSLSGGTTRVTTITAAAIFNGSDTANVEYPITRLISAELLVSHPVTNYNVLGGIGGGGGFALDKAIQQSTTIAEGITVENYQLKAAAPLYGAYLVTYETSYKEYRWRHGAPASPKVDFIGMAVATLKTGEATSLTLLATEAGGENNATDPETPSTPEVVVVRESRTELYRVVSDYVSDPDGQWEKPPNFPTDIVYPGASIEEGPDQDIYIVSERTHELGNVDRFGSIREELFTVRVLQPYSTNSNYRPKYRLEWQPMPDNTWQRAFERIDVRRLIAGLKNRYPGIEVSS